MLNFIFIVIASYAAVTGGLYAFQRQLMYYPSTAQPDRVLAGLAEMREVSLRTEDGLDLSAWYREAEPGKPTVVLFHGNAGHIGHRGGKARLFIDVGLGMLLVEYRGYGGNPGSPTEQGLYRDGRAALSFLTARGIPGRHIVLYGESLGTGVAVRVAGERAPRDPVGGLILEAPFTSIADVAAHQYPFVPARYLVKDRFDADRWIAEVAAPLLILHGLEDRIVPVRFGKRLFEAAREPKEARWIAEAGHNDIFFHGAETDVLGFIQRLFPAVSLRSPL